MIDNLTDRYNTVCAAPRGNGFRVEHMPDFLMQSDIDDCSPHVHAFYEILWFQNGNGHHTVDFVDYEVTPNTIFFLSPGQIHHFDHNVDKSKNICNYQGLTIKMCTDFLRDEDCNGNALLKYNAFHTFDTLPFYKVDDATAQELQLLVRQMEDEAKCHGEFGNIEILKALLRIFLVKIQRHGKQDDQLHLDNIKSSHQLFVNFRRMVDLEYRRLHTVQEYADGLNVAVRTLNKCVNECSQQSPLSFINDRIILEAKRMVRYTNMMIKEIAFELGYEDPSYFVKLFKRQTGYLPSDFRELDTVTKTYSKLPCPCETSN
ncbi:MAG: helix-turn-helix transcriptional regulator [Bacteroidia bacterium]|nr:helix-turn-helix transcriptional regulator [Bacteroidia bacterium]